MNMFAVVNIYLVLVKSVVWATQHGYQKARKMESVAAFMHLILPPRCAAMGLSI